MKIRYSANNSGGNWWVTDDDWRALERAGWTVEWFKDDPYMSKTCDHDGRNIGALAWSATREAMSMGAAMAEFAAVTGQDPEEEGCECCGRPHQFYDTQS
jgi:hypothetical protein